MNKIFIFCLLSFFSTAAAAQAKLNLQLQSDGKTISVGIIPEKTWVSPRNMVGSAQVVLRVSSDAGFVPGIVSKIDGLHWMDNFYVENPAQDPGFTYVCIALVEGATTKIPFTESQETILFEFKNAAGDCPGTVEILDNNDPKVLLVRAGGYNVTHNCAVLGAGKNAVTGIENGTITCNVSGTDKGSSFWTMGAVTLFPSPADQAIEVRWENVEKVEGNLLLIVTDATGREIERQTVAGDAGKGAKTFIVKNWPVGLYNCRFALQDGRKSRAWNFVVMHP